MIPADELQRLSSLPCDLSERACRRVADVASIVPADHAIVVLGATLPKIVCQLALGSKYGLGAPIYAVSETDQGAANAKASLETFEGCVTILTQFGLSDIVKPMATTSAVAGEVFGVPVGLLYLVDHPSPYSLEHRFACWESKMAPDSTLVFQGQAAPTSPVFPSPRWHVMESADSLRIAKRADQEPRNGDHLTFVSNHDLERHLRRRPAQYALDLSAVVPCRDDGGIYIDTNHPDYQRLTRKYGSGGRAARNGQVDRAARAPALPSTDPRVDADFVWLFWGEGAAEDELRWSLRSVHKNYHGDANVLLVGDAPDWYCGRRIPMPRVAAQPRRPYRDTLNKLYAACSSSLVPDRFIWMMDDTYFIRPVSFHDLAANRYQGQLPPKLWGNAEWREIQSDTYQVLRDESLTTVDYCTHLPKIIEKEKFLKIWHKYQLADRVLQWELLYGAEFYEDHQPTTDEFFRLVRGPVTTHFDRAKILNNGQKGWNERFRAELWNLFPERSPQEDPRCHERPPIWSQAEISNERYQFEIRDGYQDREENNSGIAVPDDAQRNVYTYAASIADVRSIVDLGTGSGAKLIEFFGAKKTLGLDVAEKIALAKQRFPDRQWELPTHPIECDLLICADVIEHLADPLELIETINAGRWRHCVISTPERDLARGVNDLGPPKNPRHVREWNTGEFVRFLRAKVTATVESVQIMGAYNLTVQLSREQ